VHTIGPAVDGLDSHKPNPCSRRGENRPARRERIFDNDRDGRSKPTCYRRGFGDDGIPALRRRPASLIYLTTPKEKNS
jgi:hypothetical protein